MLSALCMFLDQCTRNLFECQCLLGIQPVPLQTITNENHQDQAWGRPHKPPLSPGNAQYASPCSTVPTI